MKTIHKFELPVGHGPFTLKMPADAWTLGLALQAGQPVLWAVVDTAAPMHERSAFCAFTGKPLPEDSAEFYGIASMNYQGTIQIGGLVAHYFLFARDEPVT